MSKFVVVDEILEQLDSVKSGVVAGSIVQSVVSGVQNVPANIIQRGLDGGGGCYTTFPISPIVKNCNLDQTYINLEFDINLSITHTNPGNTTTVMPFWLGFRDTSAIFNQIQILIENSALFTTTYHREESVIALNSLPETEVRGNNQYATIEKMKNNRYCPMKRILLKLNNGTSTDITVHFKVTVDINRLDPILSNLHFTTPHFGNLRLKVWINKIQEAMFFCPDYSYYSRNIAAAADNTKDNINIAINEVLGQPFQNAYWCFYPLSTYLDIQNPINAASTIPFYAYNRGAKSIIKMTDVKFALHSSEPLMTFEGGVAEIVQKNFDIKEEEYQRLNDYFASTGTIIIPTQTFTSQTFNNSAIGSGQNWINTQIGTVGGYNINFVSTWSHPASQATCFMNDYLKDIQLLLDGRPINSLPYGYVNDKCVVDCTQAIIDTDHEEINSDYIASLTAFSLTDSAEYVDDALSTIYGTGDLNNSINVGCLTNPNTYALNFSTNLPDAFHSGACILENSNRNGIVRFNSTSACDTNANLRTNSFPMLINHRSLANISNKDSTIVGFSCFCDACLVLTYDAVRGTCFDGLLSWSAPYL